MADTELLYLQQLSEADRQLLRVVAGAGVPVSVVAVGSPAVEEAVFRRDEQANIEIGISPFLAFAVAVHRTAEALETATFVEERWAPRVRIPVFDVVAVRALLSEPERRYFLVELLASYTCVASGVTWTRTARGRRRRRFSELDPGRLAGLLEVVETGERAGIYRRLGDLALFLLGVFPDHPPALSSGAATDRLLRLSGVAARGGFRPWVTSPVRAARGPPVRGGGGFREGDGLPGDEHVGGRGPYGRTLPRRPSGAQCCDGPLSVPVARALVRRRLRGVWDHPRPAARTSVVGLG